jgi:drug/metabolite transporter (DMT)-like permease
MSGIRNVGVSAALGAAVLFGVATPVAKQLLGESDPWLLAGLLYCGSGLGLFALRFVGRSDSVRLPRRDLLIVAGAVACGGLAAPVLLLVGLSHLPASSASLLLNAETVFTAVIAWTVFRENVGLRVGLGMVLIAAGAVVLSLDGRLVWASFGPSLLVLAACACWGLDNNLTRMVSLTDATWLAMVKGLVAGPVNVAIALTLGASLPGVPTVGASLVLGLVSYGASLSLFVIGLRHLGAARAGAYFAVAPFAGAALALVLGERWSPTLLWAGGLMAIGVWLHLSESHAHAHSHEPMDHAHWHHHDVHHRHDHDASAPPVRWGWHAHPHHHVPITHGHPHVPDAHHQHRHK